MAIIGAGITGALAAEALAGEGVEVILLDRRDVASGSTAASTALLSYELDIELQELIARVGERAAVRAYQLSLAAIEGIARLSAEPGDDCGFARRPSLYLASAPADVSRLQREAELRASSGLPAEFWDRTRLAANYELAAPGAIRSSHAAEVDPYRLTHKLLARAAARGARIFDRTEVQGYERRGKSLLLRTDRGATVQAQQVVFALGYEVPPQLRRDLVQLSSTYALITEPVTAFPGWEDRCLIWETARPYRYLRTTSDDRVIIGGLDEPFATPRSGTGCWPEKPPGSLRSSAQCYRPSPLSRLMRGRGPLERPTTAWPISANRQNSPGESSRWATEATGSLSASLPRTSSSTCASAAATRTRASFGWSVKLPDSCAAVIGSLSYPLT